MKRSAEPGACSLAATRAAAASASNWAPTRLEARMCPRSPINPSLTSTAELAMPRSAMPSATRGVGCSIRRRARSNTSALSASVPRNASSARRASPSVPLTQTSSPGFAPERSSAVPAGTSPNTVMQMLSGPRVVSPPTSSHSCSSASANSPREKPASHDSSTAGKDSASVKASGAAPQAARSLRFTASALWPSRSGATVDRKCRPSTSMSDDTASCMPGAGASSAQSSPLPSGDRLAGRAK